MIQYIEIERDIFGNWHEAKTNTQAEIPVEDILTGVAVAAVGVIGALVIGFFSGQSGKSGGDLVSNIVHGLGLTPFPKMTPEETQAWSDRCDEHERTRKRVWDPNTCEFIQL